MAHRQLMHALTVAALAAVALNASSVSAQRRPKSNPPAVPPAAQDKVPSGEAANAVPAGSAESSASTPATAGAQDPGSSPVTVTPAAAEPAQPVASASAENAAVETAPAPAQEAALQRELSAVMDTLVQARARAAVLGKALWKTRVSIEIENEAEPDQVAVHVALWLDGAPVWTGDGAALRDPKRTLFSGFIAPGQHVLTYEVEQRARADEKYRYTQRASHRFQALKEHRTDLKLTLDDDSDIADDFADDDEGEYDVRARLQVRAISPDDE